MPNVNITVAAKIATNTTPGEVIVCGNNDYTVTFSFDSEWTAETNRVARFVYYKDGLSLYQDVDFTGNTAKVPVLSGVDYVLVGVYAGDLRTTTPAKVLCDRSILCGDQQGEVLPPSAKAALQAQIGNLDELHSKDKTNLVAAINSALAVKTTKKPQKTEVEHCQVIDGYAMAANGIPGPNSQQNSATGNYYCRIYVYEVSAGIEYTYQGTNVWAPFANGVIMAFFTEMPAYGKTPAEIIVKADASNTKTNYDAKWTCTQDGYIAIEAYNWERQDPLALYTVEYNAPFKIQIFGDSISSETWGDYASWVTQLKDFMPWYDLELVNSAVGGNTLTSYTYNSVKKGVAWQVSLTETTTGNPEGGSLFDQYAPLHTDADVIVVFAGTNDWTGGIALGDASCLSPDTALSGVANTTIYGAMRHIIENVCTKCPTAKLLVITPMQRYNQSGSNPDVDKPRNENGEIINVAGGVTLLQVVDAIKESCGRYGIPCLDMYRESGFNRLNFSYNVTRYTSDGLHPNAAGDERIAATIAAKIKTLI